VDQLLARLFGLGIRDLGGELLDLRLQFLVPQVELLLPLDGNFQAHLGPEVLGECHCQQASFFQLRLLFLYRFLSH